MQQKRQSNFADGPRASTNQESRETISRQGYLDALPELVLAKFAEKYFLYSELRLQIDKIREELRSNAELLVANPVKAKSNLESLVIRSRGFLVEIISEIKFDENHVKEEGLEALSNFVAFVLVDKISKGEFDEEHLIGYYAVGNTGRLMSFQNATLRLLVSPGVTDSSEQDGAWLRKLMSEVEKLSVEHEIPGQVATYLIRKYGNPVTAEPTGLTQEETTVVAGVVRGLAPLVAGTSPLIADNTLDSGVDNASAGFVTGVNTAILSAKNAGRSGGVYDLSPVERNPYGLRAERILKLLFGDFNFKDLEIKIPKTLFEEQIRRDVDAVKLSEEEKILVVEEKLREVATFNLSDAEINLFEFPRKVRLNGEDRVVSIFGDTNEEKVEAYENLEGLFQVVLLGNVELCRLILLEYFEISKTQRQIREEDCKKVAAEMLLLTKKFLIHENRLHNELNEALKDRDLSPEAKIYILFSYLIRQIMAKPDRRNLRSLGLENDLRSKYANARRFYLESLNIENFLPENASGFDLGNLLLRRGNIHRTATIKKLLLAYVDFHMMTRPVVLNTRFDFSTTPELNGVSLNNYQDQGKERVKAIIDLYIDRYERFGVSFFEGLFSSKPDPLEVANLILRDFVDLFVIADARDVLLNNKN